MHCPQDDRKLNRYFCLLQASIFCMMAIHSGFFSLMLSQQGVSKMELGRIAAVTGAASLVAQPLLGLISDRWRAERLLYAVGAVLAPLAYYNIQHTTRLGLIAFWAALFVGFSLGAQILSTGWIAALNAAGHKLDFGFSRGVGSLSFALGSVVIGQAINRFGMGCLPVLLAVFGLTLAAAAFLLPRPQRARPAQGADAPRAAGFGEAMRELVKTRPYVLLVLCSFLGNLPSGAFTTYFSVFFSQEGGSASLLGIALFVLAIVEVPVMLNYRRLERRFGVETLLVVSMLGYGLKNLCLALAPSLPFIVACLLLQAAGLALAIPASQSMIAKITDTACCATAQCLWSSLGEGLGMIASSLFCSWLVSFSSIRTVFAVTSLFGFAAAALFWALVGRRAARRAS